MTGCRQSNPVLQVCNRSACAWPPRSAEGGYAEHSGRTSPARLHAAGPLTPKTQFGHEPSFAHVCNQATWSNASMTEIELEQEFWRLCQVVDEADTPESSVPDLAPHLLAILM
jgi:hypothetical protein